MWEVKETVDLNMVNNFKQIDEWLDQFSELVDVNLDTLWKAITDNREVFISIINKVSDDFTVWTSDFVGDLEMISQELQETNWAL